MKSKLPGFIGGYEINGKIFSVILLNMLVAAAAFLKDAWLAVYIGTTREADAFGLAFFVPDMIGNGILWAAVSVSCVPAFARLGSGDRHDRLGAGVVRSCRRFFAIGTVCFVAMLIFHRPILEWFAGAGNGDLYGTIRPLYFMMLPIVWIAPLSAVGLAALQARERFNLPAGSPLVMNGFFLLAVALASIMGLPAGRGIYIIATAVLTGNLASAAVVLLPDWFARRKAAARPAAAINMKPFDMREIWAVFIPYSIILLSMQAVYTAERYFAMRLEPGTIAGLGYVFRLSQFPIWVLVTAVTAVMLPSVSRLSGERRDQDVRAVFIKALRMVWITTLLISIVFFDFGSPILSVLFQRGAFNGHSVEITGTILTGYAWMPISQAVSMVCLRYYMAKGRMTLPLAVYLSSSFLTVLADAVLVPRYGGAGIGYGAALGLAVNAGVLINALRREFRIPIKSTILPILPSLIAALAASSVLRKALPVWNALDSYTWIRLGYSAAAILLAATLYGLVNLAVRRFILAARRSFLMKGGNSA